MHCRPKGCEKLGHSKDDNDKQSDDKGNTKAKTSNAIDVIIAEI